MIKSFLVFQRLFHNDAILCFKIIADLKSIAMSRKNICQCHVKTFSVFVRNHKIIKAEKMFRIEKNSILIEMMIKYDDWSNLKQFREISKFSCFFVQRTYIRSTFLKSARCTENVFPWRPFLQSVDIISKFLFCHILAFGLEWMWNYFYQITISN